MNTHHLKSLLRNTAFQFVFLFILILGLHPNILQAGWRFDDPEMLQFIVDESIIDGLYKPETWQKIGPPFFTPLLMLSYAVDYAIFGAEAWGFYLHQVASLALVLLLTYHLFVKITGQWTWAAIGTLLCAIGIPTFVLAEQIMTRHYIEGLAWSILSYNFYVKNNRTSTFISAILYFLAILSKEVFIPLPLVLFILSPRNLSSLLQSAQRLLPHIGLSALYIFWRFYMLGGIGGYSKQIVPDLAKLIDFVTGIRYWIFSGDLLGWIGFFCLVIPILLALYSKILGRSVTLAVLIALVVPLVPVIASMPRDVGTAYFIAHRYMFVPWWFMSMAIAVIGATVSSDKYRSVTWPAPNAAAMAYGLVIVLGFCTIYQRQKLTCFRELSSMNEAVFETAWLRKSNINIVVPEEMKNYTARMLYKISRIRNFNAGELPKTNALAWEMDALKWTYDEKSCLTP